MTSITIALPDDLMVKLQDLAERHRVTPEDLVRASVEELVASQSSSKDAGYYEAINLYLFIVNSLSANQVQKLYKHFQIKPNPNWVTLQDQARELIKSLMRRKKLDELEKIIKRNVPDFRLRMDLIEPIYTSCNEKIYSDALLLFLSTQCSINDMSQLCFFLGLDIEDISPWIKLSNQEVMSNEQEMKLKKEWAENFNTMRVKVEYQQEHVSSVLMFMKPEEFGEVYLNQRIPVNELQEIKFRELSLGQRFFIGKQASADVRKIEPMKASHGRDCEKCNVRAERWINAISDDGIVFHICLDQVVYTKGF